MPTTLNAYEGKGDSSQLFDGTALNTYGFECLWGEGWLCIPNQEWWLWTQMALNTYKRKGDSAHLIERVDSKSLWLWTPMRERVIPHT